MTRTAPPTPAIRPAAAYETLRSAVLSGHPSGKSGLAIIVHRGLTAWMGEPISEAPPPMPAATASSSPPIHSTAPAPVSDELTRVLAGIIVALTTGDVAAHG